ncbi:MAG: hypothetical protein WC592_08645 [Candidatus Omnitrophota bacterium]
MAGKNNIKKTLLGLGFDCDDGRKRITVGDNFRLYGGSKMTHEVMKEKAVKFNEHLKKRGRTLDNVSVEEVVEIADKIGLRPINENKEANDGGSKRIKE